MANAIIPETEKHQRILVIEDDSLTRLTLCRVLEKLGYETFGACNGFEGLKLFREVKTELVVTDILMPDKEGLSTITEIRTINPQARIIAMSGGGARKDMAFLELASMFGATKTLQKPFTPRQILDLMNEMKSDGV